MNSSFSIRGLNDDDIDLIDATDGGAAWHACAELWTSYLDEQRAGARIVRLALSGSKIVGYGSLLFVSGYSRFTDQGIPEINNLVVAEGFRGRGIGSAIFSGLQTEARNRNFDQIGLGVGLYADYGPAQRLYVHLGYIPDGHGATYGNKPATPGEIYPLDDELLIWLTKKL